MRLSTSNGDGGPFRGEGDGLDHQPIMRKVYIEMPRMEVEVPCDGDWSDEEIKQWVWKHRNDKLLGNTTVGRSKAEPTQLEKATLSLKLLDNIAKVQRQYFQMEEPKVVFGTLLDKLLELTDSEYGFIGEVKHFEDGSPYLQTHAVTNIAWDAGTLAFYEDNIESGLKFTNMDSLFGHVITTATTVIANEPHKHPARCGIPEGHPPLNHFLGIPFFQERGTKMTGMVGIANKPGGYSKADVEFLEPFTVTCSNLIQAYNAIRQNKYLINTLEDKVAERTNELQLANKHLEEANRKVVRASQAQLQHFACMSHEIRTPLNCIMGLSSLLQETKLNAYQQDSLKMIVTSGDLLLTVVNDVLDYSKLESGNVEINIQRSNLQETLDAVVHSIGQKALQKNLTLRTFYGCNVPEFIDTDKQRLQQILYNLLGNATKFSKEGGMLDFSVKMVYPSSAMSSGVSSMPKSKCAANADGASVQGEACPVAVADDEDRSNRPTEETPEKDASSSPASKCPFHGKDDFPPPQSATKPEEKEEKEDDCPKEKSRPLTPLVRFVVKDYGRGINKKDFGRIFQPFKQADSSTEVLYGGTGLGLAITSKLVKGLNGSISVDSVEGEWSEFTVDIPYNGPPVDEKGISESLKSIVLWLVNKEDSCTNLLESHVLPTFGVDFKRFASMGELEDGFVYLKPVSARQCAICLCHENQHKPDSYDRLVKKVPKSMLLTFGPNYNVTGANGHYRSLNQVLPSVLMKSFVAQVNSYANVSKDVKRVSARQAKPVANSEIRILIAEDNAINQKVLVRMLKRLGLVNMDVVDNGKKAVELAASLPYDIVYMDIQMPIMGGLEACKLIVEQRGSNYLPKVVFVTAHASDDFEAEGMEAGGDGFVSKPYNVHELQKSFDLIARPEEA